MEPPELSDDQKELLDPAIRVVEAGPGSGKTRALVARFLVSASASTKGVALLSFTNAAVDEVRRRTNQAPQLLRAPHFVGTIDSFLHRFIVTPAETARLRRLPSYWKSWDDLPEPLSTVRLRDPAGSGVRLSSFRVDGTGAVLLNEIGLQWQEAAYLAQVDNAGRRQAVLNRAKAMINGLTSRGTYDASAARLKANQLLHVEAGANILARIERRFGALLVDEAQDCDQAEIDIVNRIAKTGVLTLVVADPDQAIFEFRGSSPKLFLDYRDSHAPAARARLTTNYRSTVSICAAVTALRSSGEVNADNRGACDPVLVLTCEPDEQRTKFLAKLAECGIAIDDAIVLAHSRKDAITVAGAAPAEGTSGANGNRLAAACGVIRRSPDPGQRLAAVETIERIILGLINWPEDLQTRSREQQLDALGRPAEWLRQAVAALVERTAGAVDAAAFGVGARDQLKTTLDPLPIACLVLSQRVKKPTAAVWDACTVESGAGIRALSWNTVHGAKGMEFEAVLLALPADLRKTNGLDVLDEWAQSLNREARRVLYVGASRARRLLAFGAGPHAERVEVLLRDHGVTVETR